MCRDTAKKNKAMNSSVPGSKGHTVIIQSQAELVIGQSLIKLLMRCSHIDGQISMQSCTIAALKATAGKIISFISRTFNDLKRGCLNICFIIKIVFKKRKWAMHSIRHASNLSSF